MAQLPSVFNTEDHDEMSGFEPLPAGVYVSEIIKSEVKDTRDKTGKYISLQFKVTEGKHKGRYIFANLNVVNKNAQAVEIAQRELKSICVACGFEGELEDTVDLHEIPIGIKLKIKPADANWPASNQITKYYSEEDIPEEAFADDEE